MWSKELFVSIKASIVAGAAIMEVYNNGDAQVEYKDDKSPLTLADKKSNDVITKALTEKFPSHALLSEEGKKDLARLSNDLCFVVDPLDGTKEFIKRNGQFTVNIALSNKGNSEMGVIYVPATEDLYFAAKELGSFKISAASEEFKKWSDETAAVKGISSSDDETAVVKGINSPDHETNDGNENAELTNEDCDAFINNLTLISEKLRVSDNTDIPELKVVMSSSHGCAEMDALIEKHNLKNFVAMGSSLKGCLVAEGKADIYYRYNPTMEWDTAAMQCIVEEAGAIFRQMDDSPMTYNREDSLNAKGFYIINNEKNRIR